MKIETKYNVGDKVWLITHNTICNLTITSIMVTSYPTFNSIKYIFGHRSKYGDFDEMIIKKEDVWKLEKIVEYLKNNNE